MKTNRKHHIQYHRYTQTKHTLYVGNTVHTTSYLKANCKYITSHLYHRHNMSTKE